MKKALLVGLTLAISPAAIAHEGHNHGPTTPVETPAVDEGAGGDFTEMASHLSFKTSHVHVMWSTTPELGAATVARLELRDFDTHAPLNERPVIYFGYRHETEKDFAILEVTPAVDHEGSAVAGSFDTPAFKMDKIGRYEFFTLLKRRGETAASKTFQWLIAK